MQVLPLPWDTEFFGVRTARALGPIPDRNSLRELETWCSRTDMEWVHVLVSADDLDSVRQLELGAFSFVDIRVTLAWKLGQEESPEWPILQAGRLRDAVEADLDSLVAIAREAHQDSRFFSDPRLPRARATALYEEWIRGSCAGRLADTVIVAEVSGLPAGYATAQIRDPGRGAIGLVGVAESTRGAGVGRALVQGALSRLAGLGVTEVEVVTQGRNVAAQRLYQQAGFLTRSVELWFHRWFDR